MSGLLGSMFVLAGLAALIRRNMVNATGIFTIYFLIGVVYPFYFPGGDGGFSEGLSRFASTSQASEGYFYLCIAFFLALVTSHFVYRVSGRATICRAVSQDNALALRFSMMAIAAGLMYLVVMVLARGGGDALFEIAFKRVRTEDDSGLRYLTFLFWGSVVFSTFAWYSVKGRAASIIVWILISISLLISAFLCFLNGGRSIFILFILSLMMRRVLSLSMPGLVILGIVVLPVVIGFSYLMLMMRYTAQGAQIILRGDTSLLSVATTGLSFLDHFTISMDYVDSRGHDYGLLYANAAMSFFPRSLWPDKPLAVSIELRNYLFGDTTGGVPPGLFGEAYISGNVFGVIIVGILYGALLGTLDAFVRKGALIRSPYHFMIAGVFLPLVGFTLVRGGTEISVFRIGIPYFVATITWFMAIYWHRPVAYVVSLKGVVRPNRRSRFLVPTDIGRTEMRRANAPHIRNSAYRLRAR